MLYVIIADDAPGSLPLRQANRPAHLARLQQLQAEGRLVLAGPIPAIDAEDPGPAGYAGSMIVAEFPSQDEAIRWAEADPFRACGVYTRVSVRPFRKTLPA